MRALRQLITVVLIASIASPTWSESKVVGNVVNGQFATVRDAPLLSGSTVLNGDAINVGANGSAQIALPDGGRVMVLADSTVRMMRGDSSVQLAIDRGSASFSSQPQGMLEAVIADATVRAANGTAEGLVHLLSANAAVVVAEKGSLEISTSHDGRSMVVPEGSSARVSLMPEPQGGGTAAAGKSSLVSGKMIAIVAIAAGVGAGGTALGFALTEKKQSNQTLTNEVSPFQPN
jgi:hypothetical protein